MAEMVFVEPPTFKTVFEVVGVLEING